MDNETTYRPTNEDCLMRLTVSPHFCNVCAEALWLALLARVDLFEEPGLDLHCLQSHTVVRANLIPFSGQKHPYRIQWTLNGDIMEKYTNHMEMALAGDAHGEVVVQIRLDIPEVQIDSDKLLSSESMIWLTGMCM